MAKHSFEMADLNWRPVSSESALLGSLGPPWVPLGGLGGKKQQLWGSRGGPGGRAKRHGGAQGAPFRTPIRRKIIKKRRKYVCLRFWGVPGGSPGKTPKTVGWVGKVVENEGVQNGVARAPGPPPGPPQGAQKGRPPLALSVLGSSW